MLNISIPIITEGKYDRDKILKVANAFVVCTNGFGIFKDKSLQKYIQNLAKNNGVIVLTDSDGAGLNIRNKINSILPKEKVINVYIKQAIGKEKRKDAPSKEGFLGVEGMDCKYIESILAPFDSKENIIKNNLNLTKTDFYFLGLSGRNNSSFLRQSLCKELSLPSNISSNALLTSINMLVSKEDFDCAYGKVIEKWKNSITL